MQTCLATGRRTVDGMDAVAEPTRMYTRRVRSLLPDMLQDTVT